MQNLELWYRTAAHAWTEALPLGNGRLGAMVFGGVGREEVQLNESTLWSGGPYQPINPQALPNLPKVRDLLFQGRYSEAQELANEHLMGVPKTQMSYQPAGNLFLDFGHEPIPGTYRRSLDLATAIQTVTYQLLGSGIRPDAGSFTREAFVSAKDDVLVFRIEASQPGSLSFDAWLDSPQLGDFVAVDDVGLSYRGSNFGEAGIDGRLALGIDVELRLEGGTASRRGRRLIVDNADSATLLINIATSFRRYDDVSGDPDRLLAERKARIAGKSYADLRAEHIAEHNRLYGGFDITLGSARSNLPTDQRIASFGDGEDPGLAALYVHYARYLMLSSSRPGTQPANLQGIWNKEVRPPWGSKYTSNINIQMNYWLPDPANLAFCVEPLIAMVEDLSQTGAEMARQHYGAGGWMMHHNTDLWRATAPIDGAQWGLWPTGGAWFCAQLWDHAVFAGRPHTLVQRLFPLISGAVRFALDTLQPLPGTDFLVTSPTLSPENYHPQDAALCFGPAMDSQILRDLFDAYLSAANQLGVKEAMVDEVRVVKERLPADKIGSAGQLQEWIEDWDLDVPEIHHRHVSHLYALYPGHQIDLARTPELAAAARKSLKIRGDEVTGWGIGWRINLWARLGEGEHAHQVLDLLLSPARSYPNLFDAHPPFQIDGNFGGAAGVLEMLVQSREGEIRLLPALPPQWQSGEIKGVRVRGGIEVDFSWSGGTVRRVRLRPARSGTVVVQAGQRVELVLAEGQELEHIFELENA